ncbi:MAG: hypothetical protein J6W76_06010, partial [Spirochaetales bacterium]|nr:hypothetical protein [Spirochaetales bacterium]
MQHNIYLYRNGEAADFIRTDTPREIIPIRLKTQFTTASTWYRDGKWEVMPADIEQQILDRKSNPAKRVVNDDKYAYCEFIENMCQPQHPDCFDKWTSIQTDKYDIEDYTAEQMAQYLSYRRLKQRYKYNTDKNKRDSNNIKKDWYVAQITADYEALTLAVTITQFDRMNHDAIENPNPDDYMPMTNPYWDSIKCVFDIKNGTLRFYSENNWPGYKCHNFCYEDEDDIKKMSFYELFDKQSENLKTLSQYMPFVIDIAYKELLPLAEKFTGLSMQRYLNNPPNVDKILIMYYMTLIPTEPLLAPVLYNADMQKRKFRFKYDRHDSLVLKKFYRKAHINDY